VFARRNLFGCTLMPCEAKVQACRLRCSACGNDSEAHISQVISCLLQGPMGDVGCLGIGLQNPIREVGNGRQSSTRMARHFRASQAGNELFPHRSCAAEYLMVIPKSDDDSNLLCLVAAFNPTRWEMRPVRDGSVEKRSDAI
jgi:hypothetical protein